MAQPHRYSRLKTHFEEFSTCFNEADSVVVTPVYPAGESPIEGIDHEALSKSLLVHGHRQTQAIEDIDALPATLKSMVEPGDMIVCLGAGDITAHAAKLAEKLGALD